MSNMSKFHIVEIDDLMRHCGYGTSQTDANNGYGCNHPEQEETEPCVEIDGYTYRGLSREDMFIYDVYPEEVIEKAKKRGMTIKEQGKCYSFSCPLGSQCDEQDLEKYDKDGDFNECEPFGLVLLDDDTYNQVFKKSS